MYILGINSVYHETAACLLHDGNIVAAVEEERLTGKKHGKKALYSNPHQLPYEAIAFCLQRAGIKLRDVDYIGYSFDPEKRLSTNICSYDIPDEEVRRRRRKEELLFFNLLNEVERALTIDGAENASPRLKNLIGLPETLDDLHAKSRFFFLTHHLCHAASSFYPSGFDNSAVMAVDGIGEEATSWLGRGDGLELTELKTLAYPHSLGFLYERVTEYLGFQKNNDEYKVAGLSSYGNHDRKSNPFYRLFKDNIIELLPQGEFRINNEVTCFRLPLRRSGMERVFGPARKYGEALILSGVHADMAAALQMVVNEVVLHLADYLHHETGCQNLAYSGGVALNCITNMKLLCQSPFSSVFIQPAAHDAGTAMGAALLLSHQETQAPRRPLKNVFLGPDFSNEEIEERLNKNQLAYRRSPDVAHETARFILEDKVVAWFQGRLEWGPRALGNRSLLGNPCNPEVKIRMNEIKSRDQFRPLCPSVLKEKQFEWFTEQYQAPFMLFAFTCKADQVAGKNRTEWIPSALHVDGTARLQTVTAEAQPLYYRLIAEFASLTEKKLGLPGGIPMVINTSLNTRGRPIVATVDDALRCFFTEAIDVLVIGDFILEKGKAL